MTKYVFLAILFSAATVTAAEIRLKSEPVSCTQTLVALGDLAEIVGADDAESQRLRQAIVCPAPVGGEKRTLGAIELRNILSRIGVDSLRHQITGPGSVTLLGRAEAHETNSMPPNKLRPSVQTKSQRVSPALVATLKSELAEALGLYLDYRSKTAAGRVRTIEVGLSTEQARELATGGGIEDIGGGSAPWTGRQRFEIRMQRRDTETGEHVVVRIEAVVTLPAQAVVARRALPKGYIVSASDVMLDFTDKIKGESFAVDPADVIGKETTATVREGGVLSPGMVREPFWVRKGDVVTVRALNNGIVVRTDGIAMQDGVRGDTIPVETIAAPRAPTRGRKTNRENATFLARICEPKTVEVHAATTVVR